MKIAKIALSLSLLTAIPGTAYADKPTEDQIERCNMPVPAPLSWCVAYIPCWAFAYAG